MATELYNITSQSEAKAQGLKHYFTGRPCKNGGIGLRRTSNGTCLCQVCRKKELERSSRYYEENREKLLDSARRYRQENPEKMADMARSYRERNKEKEAAQQRRYREENRSKIAERRRRYREKNREKIAENHRLYRKENPKKMGELQRRYNQANPEKRLARGARRRAAKRERIPAWFSELDQFVLEEAYDLATQRQELTGIEWHVDHMVPMQSRKASGLHCAANIQVIPAVMNLEKNNKMRLTKPLEWLR